ncbi:MAG: glycosyltransferase family 2 protein [Nitrospiraceae bacterium]|nr:MAG: glycosyltransferase family 2 protein [Nitrospiraceae bacterium]
MVSIVIPTYNAERFMTPLLDSIFRNKIEDMEVIIIDDCSQDDTVKIAGTYPVRVVELKKNGGPARARNIGVKAAEGDIIFFLDSDVIVLDGSVREVKEYFKKNPDSKCVIGVCSTEPLNRGFVPAYMAMFEYVHLISRQYDRVSVFAPRCGAIKKDFFLKIGGYNENYRGADVEDFELARRINKEDCIILDPKILVRHQFADFKQALRIYFRRTVMWVHLFFRAKKLDNAGPTSPGNGIAAICAFLSFLLVFFMPVAGLAKYLFLFLLTAYLVSNLKWWNFMRKEKGLAFAARALLLNYFLGIEIMVAAMYAVVSYPFKRGLRVQGFEGSRG